MLPFISNSSHESWRNSLLQLFQCLVQFVEMFLYRVPNHDYVNPHILMHKDVPHACNLCPRHIRFSCFESVYAIILKSLSNDFKITNNGILGLAILKKNVKRVARGILF